jgi:hypothetical protein
MAERKLQQLQKTIRQLELAGGGRNVEMRREFNGLLGQYLAQDGAKPLQGGGWCSLPLIRQIAKVFGRCEADPPAEADAATAAPAVPAVDSWTFEVQDDGKTGKATLSDKMNYYTVHPKSKEESAREALSNKYVKSLSSTIQAFQEEEGTFGGFAGDINVYLLTQYKPGDKTIQLRDGVMTILQDRKLILTVAADTINKNSRDIINDQWHKIAEEVEEAEKQHSLDAKDVPWSLDILKRSLDQPRFVRDSLMVLEPYDAERHGTTTKLMSHSFGDTTLKMCRFVPGSATTIEHTPVNVQPFSKSCITDHIPVIGDQVAIYSGADADGVGNEAKKFSLIDSSQTSFEAEDESQKIQDMVNMLTIMIDLSTWISTFATAEIGKFPPLLDASANVRDLTQSILDMAVKFRSLCTALDHLDVKGEDVKAKSRRIAFRTLKLNDLGARRWPLNDFVTYNDNPKFSDVRVRLLGRNDHGEWYKTQMVGEYIGFQGKYCPGGFKTRTEVGANLKLAIAKNTDGQDGITQSVQNLRKTFGGRIIFGNEGLDLVRRNLITGVKHVKHVSVPPGTRALERLTAAVNK